MHFVNARRGVTVVEDAVTWLACSLVSRVLAYHGRSPSFDPSH